MCERPPLRMEKMALKFNSEFSPQKLPKPNRKGSSSKHQFLKAMLNLRGSQGCILPNGGETIMIYLFAKSVKKNQQLNKSKLMQGPFPIVEPKMNDPVTPKVRCEKRNFKKPFTSDVWGLRKHRFIGIFWFW